MKTSVSTTKRKKRGTPNNDATYKSAVRWENLDKIEQISIVLDLILKQWSFTEVAAYITEKYNTKFSRQMTYNYFRQGVAKRWIKYLPPAHLEWERELRRRFSWLESAKVVHTSRFDDVAYHGAEMLIDLIKSFHRQNKKNIHIGFAGGHAMRKLAQAFAELINQSNEMIPCNLTLHAMVAGFDVYEPTTDPNTFFTLFHSGFPSGVNFSFVGLHTPPVVLSNQYKALRNEEGIKDSYNEASKIDIIVTSATNWSDPDSTFRKYMQKSQNCFDLLESANCIGDMLWLPLGSKESIDVDTVKRAMTLMELSEISRFINKGKCVLLVLGPCYGCNRTKSEVLKAILNQRNKLITHLVVDSRSAKGMLQ